MRKSNKNTGFTLIELLVVISVVGLLASIILVTLDHARVSARDARRISDLKSLQNVFELYASDHGSSFPSVITNSSLDTWQTDLGASLSTYISVMPTPPVPGVPSQFPHSPDFRKDYKYTGSTMTMSNCAGVHKQIIFNPGYYLSVTLENQGSALSLNDGGVDPTSYEIFGGSYQVVAC
jgi:prepilin-type N-terminal cleavage/methylation domain-containing protein